MLTITCGAAPTQIEGSYKSSDGTFERYVYFRERHGYWTFGIGETQDEAVATTIVSAECPEFMPPDLAMKLTEALCAIYID